MIVPSPDDMPNDTVTITIDEYMTLLAEVKFLRYMENHGVDQWEGFERAVEAWRNNE
jgi:hypothetical protein